MRLFRHKEKAPLYDAANEEPAIRASICTGEQTAGFRNLHTGGFREIMLIRTPADLESFRRTYGITGEIKKFY